MIPQRVGLERSVTSLSPMLLLCVRAVGRLQHGHGVLRKLLLLLLQLL